MYKNTFLFLSILFLGSISINIKIFYTDSAVTASEGREIDVLTSYMRQKNLNFRDYFKLNKEGSFKAYVYQHKTCDGGWLITPMHRNSEGVDLFERQAVYQEYEMGAVSYMLQGNIFKEFPTISFWISQNINKLKRILDKETSLPSPVFAFREYGNCKQESII